MDPRRKRDVELLIPNARCLGCRYPLVQQGLACCSECGRPYDSSNAATYDIPSRAWHYPRWAGPVPRWRAIVLWLSTCSLLCVLSHPVSSRVVVLVAIGTIGVVTALGAEWCFRAGCAVYQMRHARGGLSSPFSSGRARWVGSAVALVAGASALLSGWPAALRFEISRPMLDSAARGALDAGLPPMGPQMIGLYSIEKVDLPQHGTVRFQLGADSCGERVGLVFRAEPRQPEGRGTNLGHGWTMEYWY